MTVIIHDNIKFVLIRNDIFVEMKLTKSAKHEKRRDDRKEFSITRKTSPTYTAVI